MANTGHDAPSPGESWKQQAARWMRSDPESRRDFLARRREMSVVLLDGVMQALHGGREWRDDPAMVATARDAARRLVARSVRDAGDLGFDDWDSESYVACHQRAARDFADSLPPR